jgi:hypothetical protein
MTSERMIASNRSNSRRSSGPRTAAGRASSSRNALRHGLSVSVLNEPKMCLEVEKLARAIAGAGADGVQLNNARMIAEAQLDLVRIRSAKVAIMNSLIRMLIPSSAAIPGEDVTPSSQGSAAIPGEDVTLSSQGSKACFGSEEFSSEGCDMTAPVLPQLLRLERYEGRAISRRRRAMQAFVVFQPS